MLIAIFRGLQMKQVAFLESQESGTCGKLRFYNDMTRLYIFNEPKRENTIQTPGTMNQINSGFQTKCYASDYKFPIETPNLVYSELKQGRPYTRLQNHYTEPYDRIRIGDKTYRVDMSWRLRGWASYVRYKREGAAENV